MRFLHTGDWHVGKTLFGRSRLNEHEQVLREIVDVARRSEVDCVLVAGDVYDSFAPSAEAERLVCDTLAELAGAGIATVVIGGNHDHPKRLAALRNLGDPLRIYVRPEPSGAAGGGVIEVRSARDASKRAHIAVLPWVSEHRAADLGQIRDAGDDWYMTYSEQVARMCEVLAGSMPTDGVRVLLAHLHVDDAELSGSEKQVHVARPLAVNRARLPQVDYTALGHLHKPQQLKTTGGGGPKVYAGSPLQMDFGEAGQDKSVAVVELIRGKQARVELVPLHGGRRLRRLVCRLEALAAEADACGNDWLHVTVQSTTHVSGLAQQVCDILPNALVVEQRSKVQALRRSDARPADPVALFEMFLREQKSTAASRSVMDKFETLYREARSEADPAGA